MLFGTAILLCSGASTEPLHSFSKKRKKTPFCNEEGTSTFANFQNRKTDDLLMEINFCEVRWYCVWAVQNMEHSAFQKPKTEGHGVVKHPIDIIDNLFAVIIATADGFVIHIFNGTTRNSPSGYFDCHQC
jgi:hypothetical protein